MQTKCQEADIKNYSFGFVCVDRLGAPVKHIFGINSFDPVESFDTLVVCHQCFGLEDIPTTIAMNSQVIALQSEVKSLEHMLVNISHEVERLDRVAFVASPPQPAPPPLSNSVSAASTDPQNTVSPPSGLASTPPATGVVQGALLGRRVLKRAPLPASRLANIHLRKKPTSAQKQQHLRGAAGNNVLPSSFAAGQERTGRFDLDVESADVDAEDTESDQGGDEQDQDQEGQFDGGDPDAANIMPDLDDGGDQEDTQEEDVGDSFQD